MTEFKQRIESHRSQLLRHCYRMLGSFVDAEDLVQEVLLKAWRSRESYAAEAPIEHWLMRIATNTCLNELASRRRRGLPHFELEAAPAGAPVVEGPRSRWLTPAPDMRLFPEPARALELRESVALAFLAWLQRLPPRQRAVLLLKDVLGWSTKEVATALDVSESSVSSALHRARATVRLDEPAPSEDPSPEILNEYVRCWEQHDIDAMVRMLRHDIVFSMPPHATWFSGREAVARFLASEGFRERWAPGFRTVVTRANGRHALAFYRRTDHEFRPSSLQVLRFVGDRVAEIVAFVGAEYQRGFGLPGSLPEGAVGR